MKKLNANGITLIALIITIIVLLILAGITISLTIGERGVITKAVEAREKMKIAEGQEKISLIVFDENERKLELGQACKLEDIKTRIEQEQALSIIGVKGSPIKKIYIAYGKYEYKITSDYSIIYIGDMNIKEEPDLEIMQDKTQTGVQEVTLIATATVEKGEITEIIKPDGSISYENPVSYIVQSNGNYTFTAVTEKGTKEEKTINIKNIIEQEGIDLTSQIGGGTDQTEEKHEHLYETKYDATSHWKQCFFCNNKIDVTQHTLKTVGEDGCAIALGSQTQYCTAGCGYSVQLPKQAHKETFIQQNLKSAEHRYICKSCSANTKSEKCRDVDGNLLGCGGKVGTCSICGGTYTNTNHMITENGKCRGCGKRFYDVESSYEIINEKQTKYIWHYKNIQEGFVLKNKTGFAGLMTVPNIGITIIEENFTQNDDGSIDVTKILEVNSSNSSTSHIGSKLGYYYDGYEVETTDYSSYYLKPDNYAPVLQSITVEGANSDTEFSRKSTITAKFTEDWDSVVQMALYDEDGSVISNWQTATKDGTTFIKEFDVIAETVNSKTLTVKAKDRCGNTAQGKVTIGKIDTKAPAINIQINPQDEWSMYKDINIEAIDEGAGDVQIALNKTSQYEITQKEGTTYKKQYKIIGDIYEDIGCIIYAKDAVGNMITKKITIGKIDTTSPTITNIAKTNQENQTIITIIANDINAKLQKEGSGIKGYAISNRREVPNEKNFQASNNITVQEKGTYYIWVIDNAGNLSKTHQISVE